MGAPHWGLSGGGDREGTPPPPSAGTGVGRNRMVTGNILPVTTPSWVNNFVIEHSLISPCSIHPRSNSTMKNTK